MLQQTQAARVAPAFERFVQRFPDIATLAAATTADVVRAWAGLGYNRRAVALHRAARTIVREHGGGVPSDPGTLRGFPGIGPYTAAAIASIAHGVPVPAIDTNVRRVVARAALGTDPSLARRQDVEHAASAWLDRRRPGEWNQAVMDLGRYRCGPVPDCRGCPLEPVCAFRPRGTPEAAARSHRSGRAAPGAFRGSSRQLRGAAVELLRHAPSASLSRLTRELGVPMERTRSLVHGLVRDGILEAGAAARAGRPRGRVRLAT